MSNFRIFFGSCIFNKMTIETGLIKMILSNILVTVSINFIIAAVAFFLFELIILPLAFFAIWRIVTLIIHNHVEKYKSVRIMTILSHCGPNACWKIKSRTGHYSSIEWWLSSYPYMPRQVSKDGTFQSSRLSFFLIRLKLIRYRSAKHIVEALHIEQAHLCRLCWCRSTSWVPSRYFVHNPIIDRVLKIFICRA